MDLVAVIGLGNIATRHRRNLKQLYPNVKIYAMSSSGRIPHDSIENADCLVDSIDSLIENHVQLVIVASPAPFHMKHAERFIQAGIPTLIEKPVTSSLDDAKQLMSVIEKYQTPVAIGYCLRYLPSSIEVKKVIESGKLGHIYHASVEIGQYLPDWRPSKDYRESVSARSELGGGALLELSHELDYTQWLLGNLNLEHAILRRTEELDLDVEDTADLLFRTDDHAVVYVHLDFLQRKAFRRCRFVGNKGVIEWDLISNEIHFITPEVKEVLYSQPDWDKNQMYTAMILDFIAHIKKQPNQCVSISEAIKSVELIEKIKENSPIMSVFSSSEG